MKLQSITELENSRYRLATIVGYKFSVNMDTSVLAELKLYSFDSRIVV